MGIISTPGPAELLVILVIALVVLGPKRLTESARALGRGLRELRTGLSEGADRREDQESAGRR
ncbi:MAG TPA: twin-arginine translocase TatA/TatE family subunit [Thermoleophilaceae bacterium]|jgi:sec-independent protein translocase protein TatA|nr:twin-arginine translocase TatA/TatE family subunit [Thermoleophilaceae bacterium]